MKKLFSLMEKQIDQDELYNITEKMRDAVEVLIKAGHWEEATQLLKKIDLNMLEMNRHQCECMTEFVEVFFPTRGTA